VRGRGGKQPRGFGRLPSSNDDSKPDGAFLPAGNKPAIGASRGVGDRDRLTAEPHPSRNPDPETWRKQGTRTPRSNPGAMQYTQRNIHRKTLRLSVRLSLERLLFYFGLWPDPSATTPTAVRPRTTPRPEPSDRGVRRNGPSDSSRSRESIPTQGEREDARLYPPASTSDTPKPSAVTTA
jgi:hypothetical protein